MNILGDKNTFAIQWQSSVLEERWFPMHLCFWTNGEQIGNYEDTLQVYYYITRLEDFLLYEDIRYHPFLYIRSKEDIFNHVYQRANCFTINNDKEESEIECWDPEPFDQYFLEEEYQSWLKRVFTIGDMFFPSVRDYDLMFINEPHNRIQKVIWLDKSKPRFTLHEHVLPIGYFENIAREFLKQSIDFLRDNGYDVSHFDTERKQDWYGRFRRQRK